MDFIWSILLLILSLFSGESAPASPAPETRVVTETVQVIRVIDGDTIVVELNGNEETVRYIGIDTPEPYRDGDPACFSLEASLRNEELVSGKWVELVPDQEDRDRYDRLLRYVYVDGVFVNQVLVAEGYAGTLRIEPNTEHASEFSALAAEAKLAELGQWGACDAK